jgi:hypothetical protein
MDEDRKIRFAIPPLFLIITILFGAYIDKNNIIWPKLQCYFNQEEKREWEIKWSDPNIPNINSIKTYINMVKPNGPKGNYDVRFTSSSEQEAESQSILKMIGIVLAGGAGIIPLGYLIVIINIFVIKIIFFICSIFHYLKGLILRIFIKDSTYKKFEWIHYEAHLQNSEEYIEKMKSFLAPKNKDQKYGEFIKRCRYPLFFTTVVFDHGFLYNHCRGMRDWLMRRWSMFACSSSIATSLFLVLLFSSFLNIELFGSITIIYFWTIPTLILIILMSWNAYIFWREAMKMLYFLSTINLNVLKNEI